MDKTSEFLSICQSLSRAPGSFATATPGIGGGLKKSATIPRTRSAFNEAASDIAQAIEQTSRSLSTLTRLIRRQGLFDDPTEEINNLVYRIKEDIGEITTKCDSAQHFIDTNKKQQQSSAHSQKVVGQLKEELVQTTKEFKNVLEIRSSKIKDQQKRRSELTGSTSLSLALTPRKQPNAILPPTAMSYAPTPYSANVSSQSMPSFAQAQEQSLLVAPPSNLEYFESRAQAIGEVEKAISELGTLFQRVAGMVAMQQEMVDRIDDDIEVAVHTVEETRGVLQKLYDDASSNRGLYTKIFGILLVFLIFFVLFLM